MDVEDEKIDVFKRISEIYSLKDQEDFAERQNADGRRDLGRTWEISMC